MRREDEKKESVFANNDIALVWLVKFAKFWYLNCKIETLWLKCFGFELIGLREQS